MAMVSLPFFSIQYRPLFIVLCLIHVASSVAQEGDGRRGESFVMIDPEGKKGFMFGANIGYYLPNDQPATFYDGTPKGDGFLDLNDYLSIDYIRQEVLEELGNGASTFYLAEYASDVRYNNVFYVGAHLRYQLNWTHALVADINYSAMRMDDFFVLAYANSNGTSQDIFQNFPISGTEDRMFTSIGYQVNLSPPSEAGLNFEFGPELVSVKVKSNTFSVGNRTYNILRTQTIGPGNQLLSNSIPTTTFFGGYAQFGANLEFDKFTIDLCWRSSFHKIQLSDQIPTKLGVSHTPYARLVYRLTVKGF